MNFYRPVAGLAVRSAGPKDREAISAFVAASPEAQLFHLPQWGEAVEAGCGHRTHYLLAVDGDQIAGLLPLTEIHSLLFGSALVSAGFGVGGGIIGEGRELLAAGALDLARERASGAVELRGGRVPKGWTRDDATYATFSRSLEGGDEAILESIRRRQRAEIRKGMANGLEISAGRDLDAHYRLFAESVHNHGTPVFPRALFAAMLSSFGDDADILVASKDGRPVASVLSFYFKGSVYPYWGGGGAEARSLRANELLHYSLMCHAARRGSTRFEFGRSKVGTGPYSYKKNWGMEPEPLVYASSGKKRETNPLNPKYRLQVAAWRKLPLWLANRLGPPIARGLG